jgi:hypothetical protein
VPPEEEVEKALAVVRTTPRAFRVAEAAADDPELRVHGQVAAARLEAAKAEVTERAAVAEPEGRDNVQDAAGVRAHQTRR